MKDAMEATIDRYCLLVENGNIEEAIRLVEEFDEANPGRRFVSLDFEIHDTNALNVAADKGAVGLVNFLVERAALTAPLDTVWLDGALFFAKDAATVDVLVAAGGNVNALSYCGRMPLHAAARMDRVDVIEALVRRGADIEAVNFLGRTAVMTAILTGRPNALRTLIKLGADIEKTDAHGCNVHFHALSAVILGNDEFLMKDCLSVIIERGIDPRIPFPGGETPVSFATEFGAPSSVTALLEKHCFELDQRERVGGAQKASCSRDPCAL